jgi:Acetyltransferase (GNAT) domain
MPVPSPDVISPVPPALWRQLLVNDEQALAFQGPEWLGAICSMRRFADASRLYDFGRSRQLVLPLVRARGAPARLAVCASHPVSWETGGLVTPSGGATHEEMTQIVVDLRAIGLSTIVRPSPWSSDTWSAAVPSRVPTRQVLSHVLDLDGGFANVWRHRFRGAVRTGVRKAEKSGVVVERDSSGRLVPIFHKLYVESIERWAAQSTLPRPLVRVYQRRREPLSKLQAVAQHLQDACVVWIAWWQGQPVAGIVVVQQGRNVSYWRGAMDKALAGPVRANDLLHAAAVEHACSMGCDRYAMGLSGGSVSAYKERFGATPVSHQEFAFERLPLTVAVELGKQSARALLSRLSARRSGTAFG